MTITSKHLIEFCYYITPDGVQYPLFGGKRALMGWTAFGLPPLHYIKDRGPFQHGSTVRDYRLDDRVIDLKPFEAGCERQDYWDHQGALLDAIRPNRGGPGRLLVILPDFTEREIFVRILEGPNGDYDAADSLLPIDMRESLRFEAADPVWRDPNQQPLTAIVNPASACLPFCLPNCIVGSNINADYGAYYYGTWLTYPIIYIHGPIKKPLIANLTTGETIQLDYDVADGETVTIFLSQNIDTVTSSTGANLIGTVINPSDLATFHLEVDPIALGGYNLLHIEGTGADANTSIVITYYTNYLGVPK